MRMVLTRLGEGSRMAVTGDPTQTDLRRGEPSGLPHALRLLQDEQRIAVHRFTRHDVVRHGLVARIVDAYERDDAVRSDEAVPSAEEERLRDEASATQPGVGAVLGHHTLWAAQYGAHGWELVHVFLSGGGVVSSCLQR